MRFEFSTATRIIFGHGTIQEAAPLASEMGKGPREAGTRIRAFVVTGRTVERVRLHLEQLKKQAIEYVTFNVPGEPTTTIVRNRM